ncbi:glycosyltransferase family 2 protein [filamentous cyanobacterium LEGE 11480]|uniref:Glycosyltransferase family 2 protein n=1 Tax=Romeriopsis navalis LEGE 11480 TaxID=2777977 RepID=A0A928VMG3_9CYAN|nr:glycosyltransferase family A protein [Romeriopsis navalis]MBE9031020.1 glycosyltransferase family 2 protein [Romeriopsis navalis LEGE 11480]
MQPLVSILIPAYNAAEWIEQTIHSALAQTWKNIEIIIVDDGSSDNTLTLAKAFEQDSRIQVFSQPNQGATVARNQAFQHSSGEFIQFLDADDLLDAGKIAAQMQILLRAENNCIASGAWARFYRDPQEAQFEPEALWQDMQPVDWLIAAWSDNLMMHPAAWLVPRAIAEAAGPWNEQLSLNDDGEYFCRVILASQAVKFCGEAKSYYRSGLLGSLSDQKSDKAYLSGYKAIDLAGQALFAVEDSDRTRQIIATLFQRFVYECYPNVPNLRHQATARIKQLGGSSLKATGSPLFEKLAEWLGWRLAKRIQQIIYAIGYRRWLVHLRRQKADLPSTSSISTPAHG